MVTSYRCSQIVTVWDRVGLIKTGVKSLNTLFSNVHCLQTRSTGGIGFNQTDMSLKAVFPDPHCMYI